jgi:predicted AAA+ superfamily ATPase
LRTELTGHSLRQQQTHLKKVYSVDNGLTHYYSFQKSENLGSLFENQIYLDLKRNRYDIHFYNTRSGFEIDFIAQRGNEKMRAFQVSIDSQSALENKEIKAEQELFEENQITLEHVHLDNYFQFVKSIAVIH